MKVTPVKGTNDYLPADVSLRDYLQSSILATYENCGFQRIMTPALEDIDNLDKSEGGDNLNLIFKILKRGDKLEEALNKEDYESLSDIGLRYDLTLPLSRYYANNKAKLLLPLKCIQIDKAYRAERPQKGRLREFVQCDIDIIGTTSSCAEIELIHTTAKALLTIGLKNFKVKINDRSLLKNILINLGFAEEQIESVCITFDKLDKIGADGICAELMEKGFDKTSVNNLEKMLQNAPFTLESVKGQCTDNTVLDTLDKIMKGVMALSNGSYEIAFDISLVRGQGYYTGTVFEIESLDYKGAIAGGGRYDNLIGKFLNEAVPAVGFSIGFERIFQILRENEFVIPNKKKKLVLLYDEADFDKANQKAEEFRSLYQVALYEKPKKTGKFLNRLEEQGYDGFYLFGQSEEITTFKGA